MRIQIEDTLKFDAEFDVDDLILEFKAEWLDFLGDIDIVPTVDDKEEFVREMVAVMGARDFTKEIEDLGGKITADRDTDISVLD